MNNNIQSSKAIAVANRRHLASVCAAKCLARKAHEQSPFRFIIVNANKEHVGVIDCEPSNNGKYYAFRSGVSRRQECFTAAPIFRTFESALDFVTTYC
jgi:hypothetical protein